MKKINFKWLLLSIILSIASINAAWADTRLFTTGQKVFFQDATLSTLGNACWKSGTNGNVYAYFFNGANSEAATWAESAGRLVCGTDGSAGAIYEFTVPENSGVSGSWWNVIFTRGLSASWESSCGNGSDACTWNQTTDQYTDDGNSLFTISDNKDNNKWTGSWSVMPVMVGTMSSSAWSIEDGWFFTDYAGNKGIIKITCDANDEISFKIYDGTWYGHWTYGNSFSELSDYGPKTEGGGENFNFKADEAGEYIFQWDKTNHKLWVWEPKARLTKQKYVYFDARNLTGSNSDYWQRGNFTARFYFKYYDSGDDEEYVDCTKANALEDWVYYALVPDNDYIGQIQMNRLPVSDEATCAANVAYAKDRDNTSVNCLTGSTDWCSSWDPSWTTYCPPTKSETFADNSTTKISWQDGGNDGSTSAKAIWVKTSTTIKVNASASKSLADDNMTLKYDFKVNNVSQQNTTTASYSHSASANNTLYKVSVDAYTNYNLDNTKNSTKHTPDTIYYKALNTYSVTHTLSGVTKASGRAGDDAAAYNVAYDATYTANTGYYLPSDITVTIGGVTKTKGTDYTWTVTDGTSGALSILSNKITGNVVVTINGTWRWSIAGSWLNYPETENWDADTYAMGGITQVSSDYVCSVEVTLNANTNYTFKVVDRAASPYEYWGNNTTTYYMTYGNSSNWTFGNNSSNTAACGVTTAGAGTYTFTWNITQSKLSITYPTSYTVTFGYGTGGRAVTASVEDAGSISSGQYATAGKDITFTKTATNLAYTFKGWYNASSDGGAISCMASDDVYDDIAANISVYAQFKTRYGLHGSLMDNNAGGMPGWAGDGADFTVVSYTDIGKGTGKGVDLECSRTLEPNKEYKFCVQDRAAGSRWGLRESAVLPAGNNVKLSTYGDTYGKDVYINTVGYGTYTFKITNMYDNGDGKYYPAIEVSRPASSRLTLGWKYYTNDDLNEGNTGGTVTAATNEGSGYDITNGQFYANGSNLTFTASPATGYHVEGWYSDASCSSAYTSGEGGATISGEGNVTLALASVSTNKTVYVKFTEDTKKAASGDGDWSAKVGDSKITDVVTISSTITVDVDHALAKRVILDQSGDGKAGKLVITANKGLEVAEGIWINNGTSLVAPTAEDLVLESSASGNATLIFNNSNSAAATVQMYSKASIDGSRWNWQYMASPYVSASALHNYYGSYLYSWGNGDRTTTGWFAVPNGGSVEPFVAYCITNTTAGNYYQMEGTMVETDGNNQSISVPEGKNWVVGNSWTAPIQIGQLQDDDFTGLLKNVYLYNTGMDEKGEAEMVANPTGEARYAANTYVSIPIHAALYSGISVVSSLQGFYVKDDPEVDGGGTLKLNYANHVRPSGGNSIQNGAMHAPKRIVADENEPNVLKIKVCGSKYDDRLVLLERADFSMGYDAGWDGDKMGNVAASPRITVEREDGTSDAVSAVPDLEGLAINFRAANTDNQQTLYFEYSDDIDPLYIVDVTNNEYTRVLTGNSYTFSTSDNEEHPRFILTRYGAPQVTTGVDDVQWEGTKARKLMIDGALYIIRDGRIYNAEGALVK